jgi:hypothetical protein
MRERVHSHPAASTARKPRAPRSSDWCEWRACVRPQLLMSLVEQAQHLSWSRRLIGLLLEELHISDDFDRLIGPIRGLPPTRYPQLLAVALVIRHSWSPQDPARISNRLGLSVRLSGRTTEAANHQSRAATATAAASRPPGRSQSSKAFGKRRRSQCQ